MKDMEDWVNLALSSVFFGRDPVQGKWHPDGFYPLRKCSHFQVESPCAPEGDPGHADQLLDMLDRTSVYMGCFFVFNLYLAARELCTKRGG